MLMVTKTTLSQHFAYHPYGRNTDNDRKYGEWQYIVDFAKKEVK